VKLDLQVLKPLSFCVRDAVAKATTYKDCQVLRAERLRLQFFGFLYEGEEALGADPEIDRSFGVLGALGLFDAALEIGNFSFRQRESCGQLI
jgi:hypothetical protein